MRKLPRPREGQLLGFLKFLFYLIITVAIIIVGGSFLLPAEAVVTRSTEIAAPPEKVFAVVGDLNRFKDYSPWQELDPNTQYTVEGPATGVGQKVSWTSQNTQVDWGSQTITEYQPPGHVASEFVRGNVRGLATWDLEPAGTGTKATWSLKAPLDGIAARWFGLMFDRSIGADFEKGLAKVKTLAETP
jgi:uncharacterized protein YndB with AHSA1/START domain